MNQPGSMAGEDVAAEHSICVAAALGFGFIPFGVLILALFGGNCALQQKRHWKMGSLKPLSDLVVSQLYRLSSPN